MSEETAATRLGHTPWQTVGPFFHYALPWTGGGILVTPCTQGERITVIGRVLDGGGLPVPDAMVEIWQANAAGRYRHPDDARIELPVDDAFVGFGRAPTDADGTYRFETIRPGRVPGRGNTLQAPHLAVGLFGRGLIRRLITRMYFPDEHSNDEDAVLGMVPPDRRSTLLAQLETGLDGAPAYRFDIRIQGEDETVFFAV